MTILALESERDVLLVAERDWLLRDVMFLCAGNRAGDKQEQALGGDQRSPLRNPSPRYSDARIASARIVKVGF